MPQPSVCPDVHAYRDLVSGRLSIEVRETLLHHLEACDCCVQKIQALPADDTLVESIRQARTLSDTPDEKQLAPLIQRLRQLRKEPAGTIAFACGGCGKPLRVKEESAGKKVKCPRCGHVGPAPALAAPQTRAETHLPAEETGLFAPSDPNATRDMPPPSPAVTTAGEMKGPSPSESQRQTRVRASSGEQKLCGFLAAAQAADELGRLGPYRVLKVLGAGGMGVVFRAEDPQLQRLVALKAMLPDLAENESARQRFLREARAAASLKHDHVVTIHQVGEDRGAPFLAMEFLEGEALEDRLKREGKLPFSEVLRIGREIAEGLQAAHEHGLIHRDIKPGNVWLEGKRGRVKILDFGLARRSADDVHLTQSGAIIGTPAYMPPEQARGEMVDARCDLYSLGCVLYRLCTGELPFKGDNAMSLLMALAIEKPRAVRELNPDVAPPLADLIMRLLAKKPAERPATAGEVAEALTAIESEATQPARDERRMLARAATVTKRPPPTAPSWSWLRWRVVASLLLLGGTAAAIVVIIHDKDGNKIAEIQVPPDGSVAIKENGARKGPPAGNAKVDGKIEDAWFKQVAALPADKQVDAVAAKLKERNPGFDGKIERSKVEDGVVTEIAFSPLHITDISPVRALVGLEVLECAMWTGGALSDLSPLKGMKLTTLSCEGTKVDDLSPLKGMKLTTLNCGGTKVDDLSPLKGMKLTTLVCSRTKVDDLSPLKGMRLTTLDCHDTSVTELSPLKDMKLTNLGFEGTRVFDLTPLKGMPLAYLNCSYTKVSDLSPLKGLKLDGLNCGGTRVSDLSPLKGMAITGELVLAGLPISDLSVLKGMPLKGLVLDFKPERDAELLRSMKTLERINGKPAAEFWKEVEAKAANKNP